MTTDHEVARVERFGLRRALAEALFRARFKDLEPLARALGINPMRYGPKVQLAMAISQALAVADAAPVEGIPLDDKDALRSLFERRHGTEITGAYEAMMELSMYVGEEEWDSAQRHIRPASRRVSLDEAQAWTLAAARVSDANRRVNAWPDYDYLDEEQRVSNAK